METKSEWFCNKADWGDGPWQTEPDKLQWLDPETNLPCLAVRQQEDGHWCGYVGVAKDHALYGKGYDDIGIDLEAHRGINYASACSGLVCHSVEPGEDDDVWWFGFDCGHYNDYQPAGYAREFTSPSGYKTLDYVRDECRRLAQQLKECSRELTAKV